MTTVSWILLGLFAYTHLVGFYINYKIFRSLDEEKIYQDINKRKILVLVAIFSFFWELLPVIICLFLFFERIAIKKYLKYGNSELEFEKFKKSFWYDFL